MRKIANLPENICGIYQIINTVTEHRYIGYSCTIRNRCKAYLRKLNEGMHDNIYLQNAWIKYGKSVFKFEILQECEEDKLAYYEDYWAKILMVHNKYYGYNILMTDPNGKTKHSEETKLKFKQNMKGKSFPQLAHEKARIANIKKMTPEYNKMLTESRKHLDWKAIHREKCGKRIINTETGEIYNSLIGLSELLNVKERTLAARLNGRLKNFTPYKYL